MHPRQIAIKLGAKYYIGKPCATHHVTRRYTKTGDCVQCQRERSRSHSVVTANNGDSPAVYYDGRVARQKKMPKVSPFPCLSADHYWWLAGWNDRDLELGQ